MTDRRLPLWLLVAAVVVVGTLLLTACTLPQQRACTPQSSAAALPYRAYAPMSHAAEHGKPTSAWAEPRHNLMTLHKHGTGLIGIEGRAPACSDDNNC